MILPEHKRIGGLKGTARKPSPIRLIAHGRPLRNSFSLTPSSDGVWGFLLSDQSCRYKPCSCSLVLAPQQQYPTVHATVTQPYLYHYGSFWGMGQPGKLALFTAYVYNKLPESKSGLSVSLRVKSVKPGLALSSVSLKFIKFKNQNYI